MPHTPGPWHTAARDSDYQSEVTQEVSGKTVALTYTSNDADAHLIAAAPNMLAAIRKIASYGDVPPGAELDRVSAEQMIEIASAAAAEAEGR